jgi:hypothetical protein
MHRIFISVNHTDRKFALSVRNPGNKHWRTSEGDLFGIVGVTDHNDPDTREWVLAGTADDETEARKFSAILEAAYEKLGYKRVTVSKSHANVRRMEPEVEVLLG